MLLKAIKEVSRVSNGRFDVGMGQRLECQMGSSSSNLENSLTISFKSRTCSPNLEWMVGRSNRSFTTVRPVKSYVSAREME